MRPPSAAGAPSGGCGALPPARGDAETEGKALMPSGAAAHRPQAVANSPPWAGRDGGARASVGGALSHSAFSRSFQIFRSSCEGAVPINPGWIIPAKRTPGMWREEAKMPSKSQMAFAAPGKCSCERSVKRGV